MTYNNSENIYYPGWEIVRKIGDGSFGTVYEIEREIDGRIEKAALKVISIPKTESEIGAFRMRKMNDQQIAAHYTEYKDKVVNEYKTMARLRDCEYIVDCRRCEANRRSDGIGWNILIEMELLTPLQSRLEYEFSEADTLDLGIDLCRALVACQEEKITHRDIKPQNIFVSEDGTYKLGDFGVARELSGTTQSATRGTGTYEYIAPEVQNGTHYSNKSDVYSLGIVMYQLLNEGRLPFEPLPPALPRAGVNYTEKRLQGMELPEPKNGSEDLKSVVLKACEYSPEDRYQTAAEMLRDLVAIREGRRPSAYIAGSKSSRSRTSSSSTGSQSSRSRSSSTGTSGVYHGSSGSKTQGTASSYSEEPRPKPEPISTGTVSAYSGESRWVPVDTERKRHESKVWPKVLAGLAAVLVLAAVFFFYKDQSGIGRNQISAPAITLTPSSTTAPVKTPTPTATIAPVTTPTPTATTTQTPETLEITSLYLDKDNNVEIEWNSQVDADGYYVYYYSQGDYKTFLDTSDKSSWPSSWNSNSGNRNFVNKHSENSFNLRIRESDWNYQKKWYFQVEAYNKIEGRTTVCGKSEILSLEIPFTWIRNDVVFNLSDDFKTLTISGRGTIEETDFSLNGAYSQVETVVIKNGLTAIGNNAFRHANKMKSIQMPDSIVSIGEEAFSYKSELKQIVWPSHLKHIGSQAFSGCVGLESISLSDSVQTISKAAFFNCNELKTIWIPGSVTEIGENAFADCNNLKEAYIREGVKRIGKSAFSGSASLMYVTIPESVEEIGAYAFMECKSLAGVTLSEGLKKIDQYAFCGCESLMHVVIPESVEEIGAYAFMECKSLAGVTLFEGLKIIDQHAFCLCNLQSITIPKSVSFIGKSAFDDKITVHYSGTEYEWNKIEKGENFGFGNIDNSKIYYNW